MPFFFLPEIHHFIFSPLLAALMGELSFSSHFLRGRLSSLYKGYHVKDRERRKDCVAERCPPGGLLGLLAGPTGGQYKRLWQERASVVGLRGHLRKVGIWELAGKQLLT